MDYTTKTCATCKQEKPVTEFHRTKYNKDGYKNSCKVCRSKKASERYRRQVEEQGLEYIPLAERQILKITNNIKICNTCQSVYIAKYSNQMYCSADCRLRHKDPTKHVSKVCPWCKKEFVSYKYRGQIYCSHQCMSEYGASLGGRPTIVENQVELICETCGKPYTVHESQKRLRNSRFCSNECKYLWKSQSMQADGNPNYRGGTITYRGRNWGRQSRKALKRDGWTCQICKKKLSKKKWDYAVHHIKPFREFDDYRVANRLSNLISLCRSCHAKVEWGNLPCPKPLL